MKKVVRILSGMFVLLCFFIFFSRSKTSIYIYRPVKITYKTPFKQRALISFDGVIPFRESSSPLRQLVCFSRSQIASYVQSFSYFRVFWFSIYSFLLRMLFFLFAQLKKIEKKSLPINKTYAWVTFWKRLFLNIVRTFHSWLNKKPFSCQPV